MGETAPKILVCTMNAWNEKVGDNTFSKLLTGYPTARIANVFIREEVPNGALCNNYFRISEKKVIKSIFKRKIQTGYKVFPDDGNKLEEKPTQYKNKSRFYYVKLFCREAVWKVGRWKTDELNDFIDEFAPDVVVYVMSRYIYYNNIAKYILFRSKAKGIGCFWDDTFTYKQRKKLGYKTLRFFQRKSLKKLAKNTSEFFAITPKTKREADDLFGIDCKVLTKPIENFIKFEPSIKTEFPLSILYTGNLGIGRLDTIKSLIIELEEINREQIKFNLDIYSNTKLNENEKKSLNYSFVNWHSAVPQTEVLELQKKTDVLLFVESLSNKNKDARLSFSTKITDYFSASKCILAIGNKDLAPIEYLQDTGSALVITDIDEIKEKISLLLNVNIRNSYAKKAVQTGIENHSADKIKTLFMGAVLGENIN